MPKGFPSDIPIFKPSKLRSTIVNKGRVEPSMSMAIIKSSADMSRVVDFYDSQLKSTSWTINNVVGLETSTLTYALQKENQSAALKITRDEKDKETIISINISSKP